MWWLEGVWHQAGGFSPGEHRNVNKVCGSKVNQCKTVRSLSAKQTFEIHPSVCRGYFLFAGALTLLLTLVATLVPARSLAPSCFRPTLFWEQLLHGVLIDPHPDQWQRLDSCCPTSGSIRPVASWSGSERV